MENNTTLTEKPNKDLINVLKKKLTQKIRIQAKYINDKTDKVIGKCKVKDTFNEGVDGVIVERSIENAKLSELAEIGVIKGIDSSDIISDRIYAIETAQGYQFVKKYTTNVNDFKQKIKPHSVNFIAFKDEVFGKGVKCIIEFGEMKRNIIACAYEADLPTKTFKKPYLALEIEAFKNAMRFNYPEFVEIYDEYDIQSIKDGENIRDEHEQSELKAELKKILTK